ncbi:hypothetical protein HWV62_8823 [Athelia sp. TMB]|nr:hypothetical protein HWV62_8823 [Athelia sp. TMB]
MLRMLICAFFLTTGLGAAIPIPDRDPFYQPPLDFASSPPGTVFSNRNVYSGITGVSAVQLLYRTTYINGTAAATVATVLKGPSSTGSKLVAYNDFEDAVNTTCAPSYLFSTNGTNTLFGPEGGNEIAYGLANGWTIVVPDYEGIASAFAVGRQEGFAVLDSLRAALNYAPLGISKSARLGAYGYSGGAIATGWAASLQPTYAPELNIAGWAFGGTPSNVTSTLQNVDGTVFAGFAGAGIAGTMLAYPALEALFSQIATSAGQAAIAKIKTQCAIDDLLGFAGVKIESTQYQSLGAQLLYDPTVAAILVQGTMGINANETPKAPVYMYHSSSDEVIPYASAVKTANAWCAFGASVEFVTETGGTGHLTTEPALIQNATDWLDLRLDGTPAAVGCFNATYSAGGLPFKRSGSGLSIIEIFGEGDSKVIADIDKRHAEGREIPSFRSYLKMF